MSKSVSKQHLEHQIERAKEILEGKKTILNADRGEPIDLVNHPSHYTQGNIECIEAIEEATKGLLGLAAVCVANVIKYIWRYKFKNGIEDLKKARWYLDKLITHELREQSKKKN